MPDRNRKQHGPTPEFEVAYYTKELGPTVQREMLQRQLARFTGNGSITSSHGEDAAPQLEPAPPQEDRAG